MSNHLPNISIGDFAESLLNSDAIPPLHESQAPSMPNVPGSNNQLDISNVDVPDDFINEVLGGKNTNSYLDSLLEGPNIQQSLPRQTEVPAKEKAVNQTERLSELIEQLTAVLSETKQLLSEMAIGSGTTTVGTIGTGYSIPSRKKKKRKKKSIEETVASVLKGIQNERS
jgi:hypothetical protein